MSQKSSLLQDASSVPQVLTAHTPVRFVDFIPVKGAGPERPSLYVAYRMHWLRTLSQRSYASHPSSCVGPAQG